MIRQQTVTKLIGAALLAAPLLLTGVQAIAVPIIVLEEDFNASTQLPAGATASSPGGAGASWVNLRGYDNAINSTDGAKGFDNFFKPSAGNFLVIGDSSGNLEGNHEGISSIKIPFAIPNGTQELTISYDLVFDATETNSDDFLVDVLGNDNKSLPIQAWFAPVAGVGGTRGFFSTTLHADDWADVMAPLSLQFKLTEYRNGGSSAVGIDNIKIVANVPESNALRAAGASIPEPGSLLLIGAGLLGLRFRRRSLGRD